ncbi:MAG: maleylpyruvate isomerase N-terminal domain-containing protein [Saprospiraceae bacterium]|nr:maleylpyruvate isomerase N-terminal domain-containing protein [Saprospiraceae bacterium]
MSDKSEQIPVQTLHLFPLLDKMLIELLRSLSDEEWNAQTIAGKWKVKDVAAHLLDGSLRALSASRDSYFGEIQPRIDNYQDLVSHINNINHQWVTASQRLSPKIITDLLEITGQQYSEHLGQLKPFETAVYSVAWAGQEKSDNWFHIAREYTEKFLHQQQIRDAVHKQGLFTKELFYPFIDTFMFALPHTYRNTDAPEGTKIAVTISSEIGGTWYVIKEKSGWIMSKIQQTELDAALIIDPDDAWKLFSKSYAPKRVIDRVEIKGDYNLAKIVLNMVSVMA